MVECRVLPAVLLPHKTSRFAVTLPLAATRAQCHNHDHLGTGAGVCSYTVTVAVSGLKHTEKMAQGMT